MASRRVLHGAVVLCSPSARMSAVEMQRTLASRHHGYALPAFQDIPRSSPLSPPPIMIVSEFHGVYPLDFSVYILLRSMLLVSTSSRPATPL